MRHCAQPLSEFEAVDGERPPRIRRVETLRDRAKVAHFMRVRRGVVQLPQNLRDQFVIDGQRPRPLRKVDVHAADRKFQKKIVQHIFNVRFVHFQHVHHAHADAVFFRKLRAERLCIGALRVYRVQDHDERLALRLDVGDHALLRHDVILARNAGHRSVRRHDDADGRMIRDDLFRADLRRRLKRNILVEPRRAHHARRFVFHHSHRAGDHIAHAVDQPDLDVRIFAEAHDRRLVRDKMRLRRHDRASRTRLRRLVKRALFVVLVFHRRQHELLHKAFDKRRLSRSHRPDDAEIDVAARPLRNVAVYVISLHRTTSKFRFHWRICEISAQ